MNKVGILAQPLPGPEGPDPEPPPWPGPEPTPEPLETPQFLRKCAALAKTRLQ